MSRWSIFQDLYDSEINFSVSTFWDGGFDVKLGDTVNGFKAEFMVERFHEIEPWLCLKAIEHFPDSDFARRYQFIDYCRVVHLAKFTKAEAAE